MLIIGKHDFQKKNSAATNKKGRQNSTVKGLTEVFQNQQTTWTTVYVATPLHADSPSRAKTRPKFHFFRRQTVVQKFTSVNCEKRCYDGLRQVWQTAVRVSTCIDDEAQWREQRMNQFRCIRFTDLGFELCLKSDKDYLLTFDNLSWTDRFSQSNYFCKH